MKYLLLFLVLFAVKIGKAQCSDPLFLGYGMDTTISVQQAINAISGPLIATTNCKKNYKLSSGQLYILSSAGDLLYQLQFYSDFDEQQKRSIVKYIKPGTKILFESIKVGTEKKYVPNVTINIQ